MQRSTFGKQLDESMVADPERFFKAFWRHNLQIWLPVMFVTWFGFIAIAGAAFYLAIAPTLLPTLLLAAAFFLDLMLMIHAIEEFWAFLKEMPVPKKLLEGSASSEIIPRKQTLTIRRLDTGESRSY